MVRYVLKKIVSVLLYATAFKINHKAFLHINSSTHFSSASFEFASCYRRKSFLCVSLLAHTPNSYVTCDEQQYHRKEKHLATPSTIWVFTTKDSLLGFLNILLLIPPPNIF